MNSLTWNSPITHPFLTIFLLVHAQHLEVDQDLEKPTKAMRATYINTWTPFNQCIIELLLKCELIMKIEDNNLKQVVPDTSWPSGAPFLI